MADPRHLKPVLVWVANGVKVACHLWYLVLLTIVLGKPLVAEKPHLDVGEEP